MMTSDQIAEYQRLIIEITAIEKEIESYFNILTRNELVQYDRTSDFGERGVNLVLPFDHINPMAFSNERIEKIKQDLVTYRNLRIRQRKFELDIDALKTIRRSNKNGMQII